MKLPAKNFKYQDYLIPIILLILFSLRIYPGHLSTTIIESGKMLIGSLLYGLGMTIVGNALLVKMKKNPLSREKFIKTFLWLAVITAFSASLDHYFRIHP